VARSLNGSSDLMDAGVINELADLSQATFAGWVYRSATGTTCGAGTEQDGYRFSWIWFSDNVFYIHGERGTAGVYRFTSANTTTGWCHLALIMNSGTGIYLNGSQLGTSDNGTQPTQLATAGTVSRLLFGKDISGASNRYWGGAYADWGLWNTLLDADEITGLAKGKSPQRVRPANMIDMWRIMGRHSTEPAVKKYPLSLTGTSQADHPRIIPPPISIRRRRLSRDPSPKTRITRSTATNDTGDGTIAWTNLANVLGTDTSTFAQAIGPANTASAVTNNLVIDDLRFRPPVGVTIVGIEVSYYAWVDVALDFSHDSVILETFPVRNGVVEDGVASIGSPYLDTTRVQYTYGGATDLLGLTWDDNDTFGFAIRATSYDDLGNAITIKVNQPSVTVWYSNGSSQVFVAELVQQSQPRRELRVAIPYHV
jgi:hypothetical protein